MKLFLKPGACSLAAHIVLAESGLQYEIEAVELKTKITESGENYWSINPKGYIPALALDSGELLTEVPTIVQYVADHVPGHNLIPVYGTMDRYRLQSWLTFIGTELHKSFSPFFSPISSDDWKAASLANLERRFTYTNEALSSESYLLGESFSVADAYLFTVLNWAKFLKLDLEKWPNLIAFYARVAARPAVQLALKAEGLV